MYFHGTSRPASNWALPNPWHCKSIPDSRPDEGVIASICIRRGDSKRLSRGRESFPFILPVVTHSVDAPIPECTRWFMAFPNPLDIEFPSQNGFLHLTRFVRFE